MERTESDRVILRIRESGRLAFSAFVKELIYGLAAALLMAGFTNGLGAPKAGVVAVLGALLVGAVLGELIRRARSGEFVVYEDRLVAPGGKQIPLERLAGGTFLEFDPARRRWFRPFLKAPCIRFDDGTEIFVRGDRYEPDDLEMLRSLLQRRLQGRIEGLDPTPEPNWHHVMAWLQTEGSPERVENAANSQDRSRQEPDFDDRRNL